uniref:Uncharacterized protein n=1 Tax=Sphaerodactylus townsendi TaxID=933632 RepID=A0ACB8EFE9_9SAUR
MATEWKEAPSLAFLFQPAGLQHQVKQEPVDELPYIWGSQEYPKAVPILSVGCGGSRSSLWGNGDVSFEGSVDARQWLRRQEIMEQTQLTSRSLPEAEQTTFDIEVEQLGRDPQLEADGDVNSVGIRLIWETEKEEKPNLEISKQVEPPRMIMEKLPWRPMKDGMPGNRHKAEIEPRNASEKQEGNFAPGWGAAKDFGDANEGTVLKNELQSSYVEECVAAYDN